MSNTDIKMGDVFDLPFSVEPSGVISDDHCNASGEFCGTMEQSKAAVHAINNHDKLVKQVEDLEFSLDDRDCYIADVDMKNEALAKQVSELRAALKDVSSMFWFDLSEKKREELKLLVKG